MASNNDNDKSAYVNDVITPMGRMSFVHLDKPDPDPTYGKNRYRARLLISKQVSIKGLIAAVLECANKAWPNRENTLKTIDHPFRDGDKKADQFDGYADHWYFNASASAKRQPTMINKLREPISPDELYAGCNARFVVHCRSYEQPNKQGGVDHGVSLLLDTVQKHSDNTRFSGGNSGLAALAALGDEEDPDFAFDKRELDKAEADLAGSSQPEAEIDNLLDDKAPSSSAGGAADDLDALLG